MENKILDKLNTWQAVEDKLNLSLLTVDKRGILKEKLRFFDDIMGRFNGTPNAEEQTALRMMRRERSHISKQLYPNPFIRFIRSLANRFVVQNITIASSLLQEQNKQILEGYVKQLGFGSLAEKVREQISKGHLQFSVSTSSYINDKERIDHELLFSTNSSGLYQMDGYKSRLMNETKPGEIREHFFNRESGTTITANEAVNLLSGRAIEKAGVWQKFDLNDKDQHGNFRMKKFDSQYGYDIEKVLKNLPLKEGQVHNNFKSLLRNLKQGNREHVTFIHQGNETKYFIQADPQFKSLQIFDEGDKKVSLAQAVANKQAQVKQMAVVADDNRKSKLRRTRHIY
ncbi:hypothetical protein [Mucilaginibacter defluvii]